MVIIYGAQSAAELEKANVHKEQYVGENEDRRYDGGGYTSQ
jgi:hypothetical protein